MSAAMKLPDGYEIYCFDYYDTIVKRTVEPEYVKKIWAKEVKNFYAVPETVRDIYLLRNRMEAELCRENEAQGLDLEFAYHRLATGMYEALHLEQVTVREAFCESVEGIELAIESRVQVLCEDTVSEIKRLRAAGKKIVCVSDFYTSVDFLCRLMEFHGIRELFDEIYVSSEQLVTKRSGRLYEYVLSRQTVPADKIFMVGDNSWSDFEMAKQKGLGAYLLDRGAWKKEYEAYLAGHEDEKYMAGELDKIYRACKRDKYEDLAFSLYCFIDKLYTRLRRENRRDVFFLSREGEFLKKLFDKYQSVRAINGVEPINSHYLMVSRKATFIASLKPLEEEAFEMIFRQYVNISLYDFLSSLGFSEEVQLELGKQLGVDIYEKQVDLPRTELYAALRCNPFFVEQYESLRTEQKQNFREYLQSFGVDFEKDGMCLVDVGWKGTIQDNICMFFEEKVRIVGLYLGLVAPGKVHENNVKDGLLFTCIPFLKKFFYVYDENKSVFEVMLGASHGSADHYVKTDSGIEVATAEKQEERELFQNLISPMQAEIFGCFEKIDAVLMNHSFDEELLEQMMAGYHARLVFLPKSKQIDLFYHIYHYENFGVFEFTKFKTANRITIRQRLASLKKIFLQRRVFFQSSFWGIIALKDAGLGMLIRPYGWYMYDRCYRKEIG